MELIVTTLLLIDFFSSRTQKHVVMNFDLSGENKKTASQKQREKKHITDDDNVSIDGENSVFVRQPVKTVVIDDSETAETSKTVRFESKDNHHAYSQDSQKQELPSDTRPAFDDRTALTDMLSPRQKLLLIPRGHLTKAERMRLDLDLEKTALEKVQRDRAEKLALSAAATEKNTVEKTPISNTQSQGREKPTQSRNKKKSFQSQSKERSAVLNYKVKPEPDVVEPDFIPGLSDLHFKAQAPQASESHQTGSFPAKVTAPSQEPPQLPTMLTKAQIKRLQWDQDRGNIGNNNI